ncbi:MAG: SpoIIE family protein phosphatase [Butyrivibrio sp.]|nr:SpoIIE family protein phosphatase [Butyrivibrio sp.]
MKKTKSLSLGFKIVAAIIIMVVVLSCVLGIVTKVLFDQTIDAEYKSDVINQAETVGAVIDLDAAIRLKEKVADIYYSLDKKVGVEMVGTPEYDEYIANFQALLEDPDYLLLEKQMEAVRMHNTSQSLYILFVDPVDAKTVYVVDSSDDPCEPGDFDPVYENNINVLTDPEYGFPAYITNTPEYGWLISHGAPLHDRDGNVFAYSFSDISMNDIKAKETAFSVLLITITVVISLILCFIYIHLLRRVIVKPINSLSKAALSYTNSENEHVFENLKIKTGDEIENLADAMKQMEKDIDEYITNITNITAEKERIGAELGVATQIQADMLPRIFPSFPDKTEFELYASMDPAKEVGGDFYDFFLIDETHLGLVVADVSGKGVPAALFMVIAKTLIKNRALIGGTPAEILSYANEQLCEGNDAELFVTVWFAILDITTGKGIAANAGHEHPIIKRAGGQYELVVYKHSLALATIEGLKIREHEFELHHGDTLLSYTDGVTEATNKDNKLFGTDRLLETLNKNPDADVYGVINGVKASIDEFVGDAPQFDDITMLCLHFN